MDLMVPLSSKGSVALLMIQLLIPSQGIQGFDEDDMIHTTRYLYFYGESFCRYLWRMFFIHDSDPPSITWTIEEEPIVVTTTLDSQIDGFGDEIEDGGSTASDTITFTFSGHITPEDAEVDRQGFECTLDGDTLRMVLV